MPVDRDDTSRPISSSGESSLLRREVLNPTPHNTGVGVMLVASAAMFFAVASSAFILRSHQSQCDTQSAPTIQRISVDNPGRFEVLSVEIIDTDLQGEGMTNCGDPLVKPGKGNSTDIIFSICP